MNRYAALTKAIRDNADAMTALPSPAGLPPIRVPRGPKGEPLTEHPGIDAWIVSAFAALCHTAQHDLPFELVPCTMNGIPAVMIAQVQAKGENVHVMPLFMAVQPWMTFGPPLAE